MELRRLKLSSGLGSPRTSSFTAAINGGSIHESAKVQELGAVVGGLPQLRRRRRHISRGGGFIVRVAAVIPAAAEEEEQSDSGDDGGDKRKANSDGEELSGSGFGR